MSDEQLSEKMDQAFQVNYPVAEQFAINPQQFFDDRIQQNPIGARDCFDAINRKVVCVDGRLADGNIAIAGSLVLASQPTEAAKIVQSRTVELGGKLAGLTSHEGCGAAALKQVDPKQFSQDLSQQTGIPYVGHLPVNPADFHDEVLLYYVATSSIGLQHLPGMPKGFRISRQYFPHANAAVYEADVCLQIAFGDHGLAQRFTADQPFLMVVIGDERYPEYSAEVMSEELAHLTSDRVKLAPVTYSPPA